MMQKFLMDWQRVFRATEGWVMRGLKMLATYLVLWGLFWVAGFEVVMPGATTALVALSLLSILFYVYLNYHYPIKMAAISRATKKDIKRLFLFVVVMLIGMDIMPSAERFLERLLDIQPSGAKPLGSLEVASLVGLGLCLFAFFGFCLRHRQEAALFGFWLNVCRALKHWELKWLLPELQYERIGWLRHLQMTIAILMIPTALVISVGVAVTLLYCVSVFF